MAKICISCEKKLSPLSYTPKFKIGSEEYDMCDKCYAIISKAANMLNLAEDKEKYLKNKEDVVQMLEKSDFSQKLKDYFMDELIPTSEINIEEKEKKNFAREEEERKRKIFEAQVNQQFIENLKQFKTTTGYDFQGYTIENYLGIVSGEVVLGTGFISEFTASFSDLFGTYSNTFSEKMRSAKEAALNVLIKNAMMKGANAIIGVDFDYLTFSNNIMGVSANGTAVVIKKIEE